MSDIKLDEMKDTAERRSHISALRTHAVRMGATAAVEAEIRVKHQNPEPVIATVNETRDALVDSALRRLQTQEDRLTYDQLLAAIVCPQLGEELGDLASVQFSSVDITFRDSKKDKETWTAGQMRVSSKRLLFLSSEVSSGYELSGYGKRGHRQYSLSAFAQDEVSFKAVPLTSLIKVEFSSASKEVSLATVRPTNQQDCYCNPCCPKVWGGKPYRDMPTYKARVITLALRMSPWNEEAIMTITLDDHSNTMLQISEVISHLHVMCPQVME